MNANSDLMRNKLVVALALLCHYLYAQEQKIIARVVESGTEKSVAEAKISIDGTTKSTFTNHLGWFELMIDRSQHQSMSISHISYKITRIRIPSEDRFKLYLEKDTVRLRPLNLDDYAGTPVSQNEKVTDVGLSSDEAEAMYPGGWDEFYKTIGSALHSELPTVTEKGFTLNFTISETGKPIDIEVSEPTAKEVTVATLQKMPSWTPATQHQKQVKQHFLLPVTRFTKVELLASDVSELKTFIARHIKYPVQAKRMGIEGTTFTQFSVDEGGYVVSVVLLKGVDASCNDEAKRVISIIPASMLKSISEKSHQKSFILPVFYGLDVPFKEGRDYQPQSSASLLPPIDVVAGGLTVVRREIGGSSRTIYRPEPVIVTFTSLNDALVQPRKTQRLTLRDNKLTEFPQDILKLTKLTFLDLEQNQIESLPEGIDKLTELKELYLLQNKLASLPQNFATLKNLQTVGLSNNLFSVFPTPLTSLEKLKAVDLTNNQLTEIPTSINQMKNLETIVLINNKISRIPPEFFELKKLKDIYLDGNPISKEDIQLLKQRFKKAKISF